MLRVAGRRRVYGKMTVLDMEVSTKMRISSLDNCDVSKLENAGMLATFKVEPTLKTY